VYKETKSLETNGYEKDKCPIFLLCLAFSRPRSVGRPQHESPFSMQIYCPLSGSPLQTSVPSMKWHCLSTLFLVFFSSCCRARSPQRYSFQEICLCLSWYDQSISAFYFFLPLLASGVTVDRGADSSTNSGTRLWYQKTEKEGNNENRNLENWHFEHLQARKIVRRTINRLHDMRSHQSFQRCWVFAAGVSC